MRRRLALEPLEARQLLTATVAPWPVPQKLTLSFAPDGTQIGLYESDLFATLGDHGQASAWQTEVLRAVQSWANVADLDVGVVPDSGHAFGAVGLAQGDPRFGDIRIAAFPQSRVLANAVPYRSTAGSWSGDIFLNSNFSNSATGVGISTPGIDLYSVLLNEAGNALGLQDNDDPTSAMYTEYAGARTGLAAQDVDAIRQLYGSRRPDAWEGLVGNDTQQTATVAPMDTSGLTSERVTFDGELSHSGDVDYYRIPPIDAGSHVIRFSASGRSLLVGELSVLDPLGNTVASTQATSPLANDLELRVARGRPGESLVVRVKAANVDEFAVGRYRLTIGGPLGGPEAAPGAGTWSIDHYFSALGFLDSEAGENETRETATPLATPFGYAPNSRYEALGAIRTAGDVDLYRLTSPAGEGEMLVHLDTLGVRPIDLLVTVVDSSGRVIATTTID
ncbi:MAG: matrixin family metalloprotease, partial [Pirellulales bacterium]